MELPNYTSIALATVFVIGWFFGVIGAFIDWFSLKEQPIHKRVISFAITLTFMALLWWLVCFVIGLLSLLRFYGSEIQENVAAF